MWKSVFVSLGELFSFLLFLPRQNREIQAECGHQTELSGWLNILGQNVFVQLDPSKNGGKISFCLRCMQEHSILCSSCQQPILLGQPVAGTTMKHGPEWAVPVNGRSGTAVVCLSCHVPVAWSGFLLPNHQVGGLDQIPEGSQEGVALIAFKSF